MQIFHFQCMQETNITIVFLQLYLVFRRSILRYRTP